MAFEPYPARRFSADGKEALVNSAEEEKALGAGWYDSPKKAAAAAKGKAKA